MYFYLQIKANIKLIFIFNASYTVLIHLFGHFGQDFL